MRVHRIEQYVGDPRYHCGRHTQHRSVIAPRDPFVTGVSARGTACGLPATAKLRIGDDIRCRPEIERHSHANHAVVAGSERDAPDVDKDFECSTCELSGQVHDGPTR